MRHATEPVSGNLNWDDLRFFLEVARTQRASGAAKRLGVDYTTVARRIRVLEAAMGTLLFDKSRSGGFTLTAEGQRLVAYADAMETTVQSACDQVANTGEALSGHVRIGSTEGFGCFFLAPQLARFRVAHPHVTVDLLPVPHFVNLPKREADVVIGANTWLGTRVVVLPGVTIGDGTIVAAGAVVTRDLPPDSVAAGVPAKVVRRRGAAT